MANEIVGGGVATRKMPTHCGNGISVGEHVTVTESVPGTYRIVAPGGRSLSPLSWRQVLDRIQPDPDTCPY